MDQGEPGLSERGCEGALTPIDGVAAACGPAGLSRLVDGLLVFGAALAAIIGLWATKTTITWLNGLSTTPEGLPATQAALTQVVRLLLAGSIVAACVGALSRVRAVRRGAIAFIAVFSLRALCRYVRVPFAAYLIGPQLSAVVAAFWGIALLHMVWLAARRQGDRRGQTLGAWVAALGLVLATHELLVLNKLSDVIFAIAMD